MHRLTPVPLLATALLLPAASVVPAHAAGFPEITAGRKFGQEPTIVTKGQPPSKLRFKVLSEGGGRAVRDGDVLVADFKGVVWDPDVPEIPAFENTFETDPAVKRIGTGDVIPAWDKTIPGVKIGSRVVLVAPPADGFGSKGSPGSGILGIDTLVFVIDVLDAFSPRSTARGAALPHRRGLPKVGRGFDPLLTIPKAPAPTDLVGQVVVCGTGPRLRRGQTAVVHYKGKLWRNGKRFESSWSGPGRPMPLGFRLGSPQIIRGWNRYLTGKKIGSRVVFVLPPRFAYGSAGNPHAGIGPKDTIVFVVDILRAY